MLASVGRIDAQDGVDEPRVIELLLENEPLRANFVRGLAVAERLKRAMEARGVGGDGKGPDKQSPDGDGGTTVVPFHKPKPTK
jgi:hypothetical protein